MSKMSKDDSEMKVTDEFDHILLEAEYGVLSTSSIDKKPYGVPLSFCFKETDDGKRIFFHGTAKGGLKIINMEQNKNVSFCAIKPKLGRKGYETATAMGEIEEIFNWDKRMALQGVLEKYSPEHFKEGLNYIDEEIENVRVFKIIIADIFGKAWGAQEE